MSAPLDKVKSRRREAAVPLFSWTGLLSPLFWLVLGPFALVVLLLPESIAREHAFSQQVIQIARSALLSVSRYADIQAHARSTSFPTVAALGHAVLWLATGVLLVFNTVGSLIHWRAWMQWLTERPYSHPKQQYAIFVLLAFLLVALPAFSMLPGSTSLYAHADLRRRWAFAVIGASLLFLWQLMTYSLLPLSFIAISRFLRKHS